MLRVRHYKICGSVFKTCIPHCEACSLTAQNSFCWRTWRLATRFRVCWTWRWGPGSMATTRLRRRRQIRSASVSRAPQPWLECESVACRWEENSSCVASRLAPVSVSGVLGLRSHPTSCYPRAAVLRFLHRGEWGFWVSLISWRWQHLQEQPAAHALHEWVQALNTQTASCTISAVQNC